MVERSGVSAARTLTVGEDHRAAPAAAAGAGRGREALHRPCAHGAAFPPDAGRPRLRRRHRESLLRRRRRSGVGRAVVLGQRREVRPRSPRVSAAATGEGALASAAAPVRRRLSIQAAPAAIEWTGTTATSSASNRCARTARSTRAPSGSTRRRSRACACRPCKAACRRRSISNDETQRYSPVVVGNRPVFLFSGLTARQIVLIAGRNLLVEKSVEFSDFHVNPRGVRSRSCVGPRKRPGDVSRNRPRAALLREGKRHAHRQRAADESREGDGDRDDDRSVVRVPAADARDRLSQLPVRIAEPAAGDSVCRRPRGGQHPALEDREHASRRQRRLLCHRGAVERSPLRTERGGARPSAC